MTMKTGGTSVRTQIVVDAPIELAFRVFTEDFDRIKPREHNMLAVDIAETVFEPVRVAASTTAGSTEANAVGLASWPTSHQTESSSAG